MKVVRCWRQWCWCQWSWHQRRWHQCWCQWCWRWWFWPQLGVGESHLFDNFNFLFVAAMGKVCTRSWGTSWLKIWGICQEQIGVLFHGSKLFQLFHAPPIHLPHSYMQPFHVVLWKLQSNSHHYHDCPRFCYHILTNKIATWCISLSHRRIRELWKQKMGWELSTNQRSRLTPLVDDFFRRQQRHADQCPW